MSETPGSSCREGGRLRALRALAALASGLLLSGAFPPGRWPELAWLALAPLLIVCRFAAPGAAFRLGILAGAAYWIVTLRWLLRLAETGTVWPVAALAWIALALYMALYTGAFGVLASRLLRWSEGPAPYSSGPGDGGAEPAAGAGGRRLRRLALLAVVPAAWVGLEYLRSHLLTGFPWNELGVSQFRNLVVIQIAEWGGVYAVSALLVSMNVALALAALRVLDGWRRPTLRQSSGQGRRRDVPLEFVAAVTAAALCMTWGCHRLRVLAQPEEGRPTVRVAAVQPCIPQLKKWTPDSAAEIREALGVQTERALTLEPDLVIWPETALPTAISVDPSGTLRTDEDTVGLLRDLFADKPVALLAGAMELIGPEKDPIWYNASVLIRDLRVTGRYRKQHLVPFGEYLPFDQCCPLIKRMAPLGFSCTPGTEPTVFRLDRPPVRFATLICFEDIVPGLARRAVRAGAQFLVNQTNDAWFDPSALSLQHMSHCVFRCVENRVDAVRSANTGVTCVIDRRGRLELIAEDGARCAPAFKASRVAARADREPFTFYTRHGDAVFALPCALLALLGLILELWSARRACRQRARMGHESAA